MFPTCIYFKFSAAYKNRGTVKYRLTSLKLPVCSHSHGFVTAYEEKRAQSQCQKQIENWQTVSVNRHKVIASRGLSTVPHVAFVRVARGPVRLSTTDANTRTPELGVEEPRCIASVHEI